MANSLSFESKNFGSWYFGSMTRKEATDLLMSEAEAGVFLVRDSSTIHGDYVLCVREDSKVSHYIINRVHLNEDSKFRIGDQTFSDLPDLINFYKLHYLDTTPLVRPAVKFPDLVIAKYDFAGNDPDDLPFKKGDILSVVTRDEEQWWTGRDSHGKVGSIPVPYLQKYESSHQQNMLRDSNQPASDLLKKNALLKKLPANARVKQARIPNAYDKSALKLEIGDIIKVTKININGQWEGELNGKIGHFPFTHVEFIDDHDDIM